MACALSTSSSKLPLPPTTEPRLIIQEQPIQRGFRFRYSTEGGAHGCLQGMNSSKEMRTFPCVKIQNYNWPVRVDLTLVTNEKYPRRHVHKLFGKSCDQLAGTARGMATRQTNMECAFQNIGILHTPKKEVEQRLISIKNALRLRQQALGQPTKSDEEIRIEARAEGKEMELNCVRLCFVGTLLSNDGKQELKVLDPVYSIPIYNSKAAAAGLLKICRMSKITSVASGGEEIFLLCEKVQRDNVCVRLFEVDSEGQTIWQDEARFSPQDVHKQFAIVFKTPPYKDIWITTERPVHIQLIKKSERFVQDPIHSSESVPFTYLPEFNMPELYMKEGKKFVPCGTAPPGMFFQGPQTYTQVSPDFAVPAAPGPSGSSSYSQPSTSSTSSASGEGSGTSDHVFVRPPDIRRVLNVGVVDQSSTRGLLRPRGGFVLPQEAGRGSKAEGAGRKSWNKSMLEKFMEESLAKQIEEQEVKACEESASSSPQKEAPEAQGSQQAAGEVNNVTNLQDVVFSLHKYAASGNVAALLSDLSPLTAVPDSCGNTMLHVAVLHDQPEVVAQLLTGLTGRGPSTVDIRNAHMQTPLHLAAARGNVQCVRDLVAAGASGSAKNGGGNTVLHVAAASGHCDALRLVLRAVQTEPAAHCLDWHNYEGMSALHLATASGHSHCVQALLEAGADVNLQCGLSGETPLHVAVSGGLLHVVQLLLAHDQMDVNRATFAGWTPLDVATGRVVEGAAENPEVAIVDLLMTAGGVSLQVDTQSDTSSQTDTSSQSDTSSETDTSSQTDSADSADSDDDDDPQ